MFCCNVHPATLECVRLLKPPTITVPMVVHDVRFRIVLILALGLCSLGALPAKGQVLWSNINGGNFTTGSNWTGGVIPSSLQDAQFGLNSSFGVTFASPTITRGLFLTDSDVTFNLGGNTYNVQQSLQMGLANAQNGSLTLLDGRMVAGISSVIGLAQGSTASLTVGSNASLFTDDLRIGSSGNGTLNILQGGTVQTDILSIGTTGGSFGLIAIDGPSSRLDITGGFTNTVGEFGTGNVSVTNGAVLASNGNFKIAGSNGTGAVNLSSSIWEHSNGSITTDGGQGTINVNTGAALNATQSSIHVFNQGALNVNPLGKLNITRDSGPALTILSGGIMSVRGDVNISTGDLNGFSLQSGGQLTQSFGSIITTGFNRAGTFDFQRGQFAVDQGIFDNNGAQFNIGGNNKTTFELRNRATTSNLIGVNIGTTNTAFSREFNVLTGSILTTSGNSLIGQLGSGSLLRVNGTGSTWNSGGIVSVGDATGTLVVENGGQLNTSGSTLATGIAGAGSNGSVTVQSGGRVNAGLIELARVSGSISNATFTGTASEVNSTGLFVGGSSGSNGGTAALTIADGAEVNVNGTTRVRNAGTLNVNGGTLTTTNFTRDTTGVFNFGGGTMNVLGTYSNGSGTVTLAGSGANDNPTLVLEGNSSTSGITALNVGSALRQGTLTLNPGSLLNTGAATIASRGTVNLNGGNLQVTSIANNGTFNWNSGAVRFTTSSTLDATTLTGLLGSAHNLRDNQTLASFGTLTIGSTLNVNGGTLQGLNLTNNSTLAINSGNVHATQTLTNNAGRTIQINGVSDLLATTGISNSGTIRMNSSTASISGGAFGNNAGATLSGSGQINNDLDNSGTIRVTGPEHLVFAGASNRNVMNMHLSGGTLEFTESLVNRSGAAITGRGTFIGSSANPGGLGLTNDGLMSFSAGTTDVFGDVVQISGGQIVTSGGGTTTFFDDVTHNGVEIRTFLGSRTVFLGDQSGAGNFTGTGVVEYAGDLRPGNSPASVSYEGDVFMNSSVNSFFELGGLTSGAFDQLRIAGDLNLDGNLLVSLINGFSLAANEQFLIGDIGGNLTGRFNGLNEGSLVGNFGGQNLFITYAAGNGNDIGLFTTAIPEPGSGLILVGLITGLSFHRRRRTTQGVYRQAKSSPA